jgi:hypothetical protein
MKLRVWWVPQVPGTAFYVTVNSVEEAILITNTLANYDLFQFENRIKPDYCNAGGLQCWDEEGNEWTDWYDEDSGYDFDEYVQNLNQNNG